jgi:hypothetical protein
MIGAVKADQASREKRAGKSDRDVDHVLRHARLQKLICDTIVNAR